MSKTEIDYRAIMRKFNLIGKDTDVLPGSILDAMKSAVEAALPVILEGKCEWVKCSERMPELDKEVFVKWSDDNRYVGRFTATHLCLEGGTMLGLGKDKFGFEWLDESLASDDELKTKIGLK